MAPTRDCRGRCPRSARRIRASIRACGSVGRLAIASAPVPRLVRQRSRRLGIDGPHRSFAIMSSTTPPASSSVATTSSRAMTCISICGASAGLARSDRLSCLRCRLPSFTGPSGSAATVTGSFSVLEPRSANQPINSWSRSTSSSYSPGWTGADDVQLHFALPAGIHASSRSRFGRRRAPPPPVASAPVIAHPHLRRGGPRNRAVVAHPDPQRSDPARCMSGGIVPIRVNDARHASGGSGSPRDTKRSGTLKNATPPGRSTRTNSRM